MKRLLASALLAVGLVVSSAPPANAGGNGDFYNTGSCYISNGLYGKVTNYDVNSQRDQEYHYSMNNAINYWYRYSILVDGVAVGKWRSDELSRSGSIADGYMRFGNPTTDHVFKFQWRNSKTGAITSCTTKYL